MLGVYRLMHNGSDILLRKMCYIAFGIENKEEIDNIITKENERINSNKLDTLY